MARALLMIAIYGTLCAAVLASVRATHGSSMARRERAHGRAIVAVWVLAAVTPVVAVLVGLQEYGELAFGGSALAIALTIGLLAADRIRLLKSME